MVSRQKPQTIEADTHREELRVCFVFRLLVFVSLCLVSLFVVVCLCSLAHCLRVVQMAVLFISSAEFRHQQQTHNHNSHSSHNNRVKHLHRCKRKTGQHPQTHKPDKHNSRMLRHNTRRWRVRSCCQVERANAKAKCPNKRSRSC